MNIQTTIDRIKNFEPPEIGYYLAFSGGKDSIVLKRLAEMSGVKFESWYNLTTIDPPELVKFIKEKHPDVKWNRPEKPMLQQLVSRGYPTRRSRWCCEKYKEGGGDGRTVLTGIRWAESPKRSKRQMVEHCDKGKGKFNVRPIIDWSEKDVWNFIREQKIEYCSLYDEGWKRIGCLFCPMTSAKNRIRDLNRYPRIANNFIRAFQKLYERKMEKNPTGKFIKDFKSGEEMFYWWIQGDPVNRTRKFSFME